jgi:gamma-glutamyltranspeptidase/glutathione hydrolase
MNSAKTGFPGSLGYDFPYRSQRMPVMARNVVATSQPLAAQAGLRMLQLGGNAVDAAIATAITLTVVEPTSNGIGGDAFAILWDGQQLHGLNASGRSPASLSREAFRHLREMPLRGPATVTVPGAVSAWTELSRRFGKLPFETLFGPAIDYAERGFIVSPLTALAWSRAPATFRDFPDFAHAFLPDGKAPRAGQKFALPDQARTLARIADTSGEAFYRGDLGERISSFVRAGGGFLTEEDLADHFPEWVDTISTGYHGVDLHEIPPNGQGLAALIALGILRHHSLADAPVDSADSLHLQVEAMKLAFADAHCHIADPGYMSVRAQDLLADDYLRYRAKCIDPTRASDPRAGIPGTGGTVYLTAADESGMMISFIQSNYYGFGSGLVVPGTGISLQNRASGFVLEDGHANELAGGKRPFHTIIPGFLTEAGKPLMGFGVMGGPMQPQGHLQMTVRIVDYRQNPQSACDAPRWQVLSGNRITFEPGVDPAVLDDLRARGHQVSISPPEESFAFGGAQLVLRTDDGYIAASDHRKDGQAVGY